MARTRTRAELRTQARELADQVNSTFVSDTTANFWIDQAIAEVWDIIVMTDPDQHYKTTTFTTTSGIDTYSLPADFYRLKGVDLQVSSKVSVTIDPYAFQERNRFNGAYIATWSAYGISPFFYRLLGRDIDGTGQNIVFEPEPQGGRTIKLHYIQQPQKLTADSGAGGVYDGVAGWEDWIVYEVAQKMATKEESLETAAFLRAERDRIEKRISHSNRQRDSGRAQRIQDVRRYDWPPVPYY